MSVEILNESAYAVDEPLLLDLTRFVLDRLGVSPLAELAVSLVEVDRMSDLHVRYLGEPGPTDVLAFPQDELDLRGARGVPHGSGHGHEDGPDGLPVLLGDVVLCPEVAERQARAAGHATSDELHLLATHGVLHLLGYDHADEEGHAQMFGLQDELLASWRLGRSGA